ncbi:hypothetical protein [Treponema sp.]|uniref:hypothetical protein n=1 Tax=Treponema sp. TaxID=166 RepID=UPI00388EA7E9
MYKKEYFITVLIAFLLVALLGCSLSPRTEETENSASCETNSTESTAVIEDSNLFESNSENNSSYIFFTNDSKYITSNGYTFWFPAHESSADSFETVEFSAYKESGRTESGYGVVFCNQDLDGKDFLLSLMINTRGQYIIGKVYDGEFSTISTWKTSSLLHKGIGIRNTVRIDYDDVKKLFIFYFNGYYAGDFSPVENVSITGGKTGFVVVVSNLENFPKTPVKVIFEGVSGV